MTKYRFDHWEDGSDKPLRTIDLKTNMETTAYYKEVSEMGQITFKGSVSKQAVAGELVTITVTKPDTTQAVITTTTKEDLSFEAVYEDVPNLGYKAKARIEEDALYQATESEEVTFTIGKEPRQITLTVV